MAKVGQPGKYETNVKPNLEKIAEWIRAGATQAEIAKKLEIRTSTLSLYLKRGRDGEEPYSELSELFERACEEPDDNVEAALYKSACGYTVEVHKTFKIKKSKFDPKTGRKIGEYEELVPGVEEVHVPANVQAQQFWLANRRRDRWQYRPENVSVGEGGESGVIIMPEVVPNDK